jgi:hypothetical protein
MNYGLSAWTTFLIIKVREPFQFIFEAAGYLFVKNQRVWQGIMF